MEMNVEEFAVQEHIGSPQIILASPVHPLVLIVSELEPMTVKVAL
jgi:hypothetical protein